MAAVYQASLTSPVSSGDRLSFTIFLAVALHAALILGVTFSYMDREASSHTMEVTLVQQRSQHTPENPDYLAQINQIGSGSLDEQLLLSSPTEANLTDTEIQETTQLPQQQARPVIDQTQERVMTTQAESDQSVFQEDKLTDPQVAKTAATGSKSLQARALEIASLEAKLDRQKQIFAKRPRIKRLTSLSTASSADAFYLNSWRRKIENIGNLNYPEEARKRKLYGSLRLMVAITPDGRLKDVELLESSGHKTLDEAALRIVRLAAPFAPFPDELRKTTDVLEIIRTWQFRKNSSLRSY